MFTQYFPGKIGMVGMLLSLNIIELRILVVANGECVL